MARPAKFASEAILDATARIIAESGPAAATVETIARHVGAPTGSIYHRFDSRDLIMARLWIRTVKRAQEGFLAALALDDIEEAAVNAALHIPRWSRGHLDDARVLVLHRREALAERWPEELGHELEDLNTDLGKALSRYTARRYGRNRAPQRRAVVFALVDVPYAAVRRDLLAGQPPPPAVDDLIRKTCVCLLGEPG